MPRLAGPVSCATRWGGSSSSWRRQWSDMLRVSPERSAIAEDALACGFGREMAASSSSVVQLGTASTHSPLDGQSVRRAHASGYRHPAHRTGCRLREARPPRPGGWLAFAGQRCVRPPRRSTNAFGFPPSRPRALQERRVGAGEQQRRTDAVHLLVDDLVARSRGRRSVWRVAPARRIWRALQTSQSGSTAEEARRIASKLLVATMMSRFSRPDHFSHQVLPLRGGFVHHRLQLP